MVKKLKIATIGGGSSYTPELIEGFIKRKDKISISELWLVDIEEGREKLEIVSGLAERMVKANNLDWKIYATLDRREALKNADYVTTQYRVGLLDARIKDERIPISYNMIGQETNGAGGIFNALRAIPVIKDVIDDMKDLCPDAWLINFANPSGMVTEAAINYCGWERAIGLCNVPIFMERKESEALGLSNDDDLCFKFAGLNHYNYHKIWNREGEDITEQLIELFYSPDSTANPEAIKNISDFKFNFSSLKGTGYLPSPYLRYYYLTNEMLEEDLEVYKNHNVRGEEVKRIEDTLFEMYKDPKLNHKPELLSKRGGAFYSDVACEVITSIINDSRKLMSVNTKNKGSITDLDYDAVVEVTSVITSHGPEPISWGPFTPIAKGLLQNLKAMEILTVEAALEGNYEKLVQAFILCPIITSGGKAIDMLNEMLVANKKYLPNFAEKIEKIEAAKR